MEPWSITDWLFALCVGFPPIGLGILSILVSLAIIIPIKIIIALYRIISNPSETDDPITRKEKLWDSLEE